MLLALLYQDFDTLLAAAPACDQHACGDRFWPDVAGLRLPPSSTETAYVDIQDRQLCERLLAWTDGTENWNGRDAAESVDAYLFTNRRTQPKFAA